MSSNDFLIDAGVRHQIFVQRYAGGQVKDLLKYLSDMAEQIEIKLAKSATMSEAKKLGTELEAIRRLIDDGLEALASGLLDTVESLADYEAEFAVRAITTAAAVDAVLPDDAILRAIVTNRPMKLEAGKAIQELTINQAINTFSANKSTELKRIIQTGFISGTPNQELIKQVSSVSNRHRNQAEALIRTTINHVSSEARRETHIANSDILDGEEFVAVLDSRTTIGCAAADGNIYPIGEGIPAPRHWNCRSVRVPYLKPEYRLPELEGTRASKGSDFIGQVPATRTYSGWLRDQSATFQDTVLGAERAKLFRRGGLSLDKFTDDSGITYTLDKLRELEPQAFERAGL